MLNATHGTDAYTEKVTAYDKNGNIKALQRYGNGLIDNLTYTYSGNQLTKVEDATGNAAGFSNGASVANEYVYDNNGNLTKDSNKGITNIAYNSLNLPSTVTFTDGSSIVYSYAADGTKLRTVHTISGTTTTKDYCANVVYENGVQKMLLTEDGYVDLSLTTPAYYYYLKDHQGNNRVVINSSGTVQETNHYYPFGGVFASTGNVQPYKYNGKELDTKKGLNWYDYGARHYDAVLGRWLVVDPLAEKYYAWSPYAYCNNNPIGAVDFEGKLVIFINGFHSGFEGAKSYYWRMKNKPVNFTVAVMAHFEDWQELYYDGSVGGAFNIYSNLIATNRFDAGYVTGMKESNNIISKLARDNNGNIIETIKVITHSMGSAFSKGFLTALMDFILKNPELCNGINIAEYNFAPYQGSLQTAVKGVDTYQYSHKYDKVAGYEIIKGANVMKTKETEEAGHSINDFYDYIKNLPQGRYKIINGQIVKIE